MTMTFPWSKMAAAGIAAMAGLSGAAVCAGQTDFASAVKATNPAAYYRLDATTGKSEAGSSTYKSTGGVSAATPGAPIGMDGNSYAKFDGKSGEIVTTQAGGVGAAASMMAWVNLAEMPSETRHIVYVEGESENGNDLDLQFETDNALRFFTASGGNLAYKPAPATLVGQWHLIVVTLDTASHSRAIYWDGKQVAKDAGGGEAGKKALFSIGESTVFKGRFFNGGIEEAALWNRALKATEVAGIYAAATPGAGGASTAASGAAGASGGGGAVAAGTGPFATKAKVEAEDAKGPIQLKREEQIAMMFMGAMEMIEHDCQMRLQRACSMSEAMTGSAGGDHLKFDPNKADPNYTYTLVSGGMAWEAHATAKKAGLVGFCYMARSIGTTVTTYSKSGKAGWTDVEIMGRGIEGDSFETR